MITRITSFFFKNIGMRQIVVKNVFWLGFAEVISRLLEFVLMVMIVRSLGITEFGKFTFAIAIVSIFTAISDFGISDIVTREIAHDREMEKEYSAVFSLKIALSLLALFLVVIASLVATRDARVQIAIWLLGGYHMVASFFYILGAFLRAHQRMEYEAGMTITRTMIISLAVLLVLLQAPPSIVVISVAYLSSSIAALMIVLLFFHLNIKKISYHIDFQIWKKFLQLSWPLGLAAILGTLFVYADSVIMGFLGQVDQNAWYNAARKIIIAITVVATFFTASFYALLNNLVKHSQARLQRAWNYYVKTMIMLALPTVVGGVVLAPQIIHFVFGSAFNPSILVFRLLTVVAAVNFLYSPYVLILIVHGKQKQYFWINLAAALANIILNILLIPIYGFYGATFAAITTYVLLLAVGIMFVKKYTPMVILDRSVLASVAAAGVASFVMLLLITRPAILDFHILITSVLAAIVYFSVFFAADVLLGKLPKAA